jgi:hypothetical protein
MTPMSGVKRPRPENIPVGADFFHRLSARDQPAPVPWTTLRGGRHDLTGGPRVGVLGVDRTGARLRRRLATLMLHGSRQLEHRGGLAFDQRVTFTIGPSGNSSAS